MATKTFSMCSLTCLPCQKALPANVILEVASSLTISAKPYINASLTSSGDPASCNGAYNYTFSYDDTQMVTPGTTLTKNDVVGIVCKNSLTSYILADPLKTRENVAAAGTTQGTATLTSGEFVWVSGANGTAGVVLNSAADGKTRVIMNGANAVLKIYPVSGGNFIGKAANASSDIAAYAALLVLDLGAGTYFGVEIPTA